MAQVLAQVDPELIEVLGDQWTTYKAQMKNFYAGHSLLVLWTVIRDPLFGEQDPEQ